jgi:hypothetical protein
MNHTLTSYSTDTSLHQNGLAVSSQTRRKYVDHRYIVNWTTGWSRCEAAYAGQGSRRFYHYDSVGNRWRIRRWLVRQVARVVSTGRGGGISGVGRRRCIAAVSLQINRSSASHLIPEDVRGRRRATTRDAAPAVLWSVPFSFRRSVLFKKFRDHAGLFRGSLASSSGAEKSDRSIFSRQRSRELFNRTRSPQNNLVGLIDRMGTEN